jgi:glycosyltransferase involved in cell wall biosynthesis
VGSDHFLSIIYSAADLFVLPSLEEAFGQTALEALACGTPAVGFDAGGIPDVIQPGVTGMLAPAGDAGALAAAMAELLGDAELRGRLGKNGRALAVRDHALSVQASRYVALYEELVGAAAGPGAG